MSIGIRESTNKFAFLDVQGSSDEEDCSQQVRTNFSGQSGRRDTKAQVATESKKKTRRRRNKNSYNFSDDPNELDGADAQLRDWKARDRCFVKNMYDEDLRQAIELSKVEYERRKCDDSGTGIAKRIEVNTQQFDMKSQHEQLQGNQSPLKKGRKKNKNKTLSLEQFQRQAEDLPHSDSSATKPKDEITGLGAGDRRDQPNFFDEVEKAVIDVRKSEAARLRFQLQHQKHRQESTSQAKRKTEGVEQLHNEMKNLESKFKQVKKRNKQLLVMLQQGEMKEKSELLLEIERLSVLRSELTEEVTALHQSLEQEKSRSRKYRDELLKLQGRMHDETAASQQ